MAEATAPKILVVDDEPDTARALKNLLEKRVGASVEIAGCAEAARNELADDFDLVTLDYQMPDCDGLTLLREIVQTPEAPPVIMVTGHGDERTAIDAFRFGASGYVVKDQRMPELLTDAVNKALLEKKLRETEEQLAHQAQILEKIDEAIFSIDDAVCITSWSMGAERLYGFTQDEAIGKNAVELLRIEYPPGDSTENRLRKIRETKLHIHESVNHRKDGTAVTIESSSWPIKSADGKSAGIVSLHRDITEQKAARERLEWQRNLIDEVEEAIIATDATPEFHITFWNKGAEQLYGWAAEEAIGKPVLSIITLDHENTAQEGVLESIRERGHFEGAVDRYRRDGTLIKIDVRSVALEDEAGKITGYVVVHRDATERTQAEQKFMHQAQILEDVDEAIIGIDTDLVINSWNKGAEHIYGYTKQEAVGRYSPELLARDYPDGLSVSKMATDVSEKGYLRQDKVHHRKDGSPIHVDGQSWPIKDSAGNVTGFVSLNRDITELKESQETLLRQAKVLELTEDAVLMSDTELRITFWNNGAERLYGWKSEEVLGRRALEVLKTELPQGFDREKYFEAMRERGQSRIDLTHTTKDGRRLQIDTVMFPLKDSQGTINGYATINRDITERKMAEEALRTANEELDGYAHMVSHYLKSPLAAINLANSLLRDELADIRTEHVRRDVEESVATIDRNLSNAYRLINGLLALAEASHVPTDVMDVQVADIVSEVLDERAGQIEEKGATVEIEGDLGVIKASELHIYQVFNNIIGNAIAHNYSPEPRVVIRSLGVDGSGAHRYEVCDNGSGIAEEDLQGIFRPFYKRGRSTDTGIGLSIAEKIIDVYGGSIRAYNDNGACFEFSLMDWAPQENG